MFDNPPLLGPVRVSVCVCVCMAMPEKANDAHSPLQALVIPWQKCVCVMSELHPHVFRVSFILLLVRLNECVKFLSTAPPVQFCLCCSVVSS